MGIAYKPTAAFAAAALLLSLSFGGCATSTSGSSLMDARAEAPPALPKTSDYLPVEVSPPARDQPTMTTDERSKLKKELLAARDRQEAAAKAQGAPLEPLTPQ